MRWSPLASLVFLVALSPTETGEAGRAIPAELRRAGHRWQWPSTGRPRPSSGIRPERDFVPPRWPHRLAIRPFGSVQGGLETGIGFGYPAPYPTGSGPRVGLDRLSGAR
jgi:hypothetical protein